VSKIQPIQSQAYIPASGKVFDKEEIDNAIQVARDGWWTEGEFAKRFEKGFSQYLGIKYVSLTNSGSSANLLAVAALTSGVFGERKLKKGDEFIASPVSFPTTVNPGIFFGLTPVFVDVQLNSLNIDPRQLEKAISKKTKLIMLAHTLGKPYDLNTVMGLAKKYNLWVVEDCCDALGSKYDGKLIGTFGDIATFSFYPAHQITMGEGGAVITNNPLIHRALRQFRDWGRDCWCDTGKDNTCRKRFDWKMGNLPYGYDHKYIYSQLGFNLKLTDFQAAIGVAQLKKLPRFISKRKHNYMFLFRIFSQYPDYFQLMDTNSKEDPCWFGFPVLVSEHAPFTRNELTRFLEENRIGTRTVFAGNLLKHPAYKKLKYRKKGLMSNADSVMNRAFWIGVFPGIGNSQLQYIEQTVLRFLMRFSNKKNGSWKRTA
jgi:CDP-4-dehydro-6-deoxyglucose reductase, E1